MADDWGVSNTRVIIAVQVSSEDQRENGYGHAAQLQTTAAARRHAGRELARRPDGSLAVYDEGAASTTMVEDDDLDRALRRRKPARIAHILEHPSQSR